MPTNQAARNVTTNCNKILHIWASQNTSGGRNAFYFFSSSHCRSSCESV